MRRRDAEWFPLCVPFAERALASQGGATWSRTDKCWFARGTKLFRSKEFRRWRTKAQWKRATIDVGDTQKERNKAKRKKLLLG